MFKLYRAFSFCLFNDVNHHAGGGAAGAGLIGVDVHGESEFFAYADYYIVEDEGTSVGINSDFDNLCVLYAESFGIGGSGVDMAFCNDYALVDVNLTAGTYEFAGT